MNADDQVMLLVLAGAVVVLLIASWFSVGKEVETNLANHEAPGVVPSGTGRGWGCVSIVLFLFVLVGLLAMLGVQ